MNKIKMTVLAVAGALALTATSFAGDWHTVARLQTGGGAKEVSAVFDNAETVQIECTDGQINIQTLWVRNGGQKREIRVARTLTRGQKVEFPLNGSITGFRISDSGSGSYKIHVKTGRGSRGRDDRDRDRDRDRYDRDRRDRYDDRYDRYDRRDRWDDRRGRYDDRDYPPPPPRRERESRGWFDWFD